MALPKSSASPAMLVNEARNKERACSSQIAISRLHRTWVKRLSLVVMGSFLLPEMDAGSFIHFKIEKRRHYDSRIRILNKRGTTESFSHGKVAPPVYRPLDNARPGRF